MDINVLCNPKFIANPYCFACICIGQVAGFAVYVYALELIPLLFMHINSVKMLKRGFPIVKYIMQIQEHKFSKFQSRYELFMHYNRKRIKLKIKLIKVSECNKSAKSKCSVT